jgi:hypothetical protein
MDKGGAGGDSGAGAGASAKIELPPPAQDDIVIYIPILAKRPKGAEP